MNKSTIFSVILVVLLILASVFIFNKQTEAPTIASENADTDTIVTADVTETEFITATTTTSTSTSKPAIEDGLPAVSNNTTTSESVVVAQNTEPNIQTSLFANGCFWCVESDMQKVAGVQSVVSGYADGTNENPTYKNYGNFGHREVVQVTYDANIVSYGNLVEHILKHGDPTDPDGSYGDRGKEYAPAIYYENETEKEVALRVIAAVAASNVYGEVLTIEVIPDMPFWKAEAYHQDYAEKNPLKYFYYRTASGRTAFINKYWGDRALLFEFS